MNILLLNVRSYSNAGDATQTDVALEQLRENFPGCQITVMINDPPSYPGNEPTVISLTRWVRLGQHWRIFRLGWMIFATLLYIASYQRNGKPINLLGSPELTVSLEALLHADLVACTPGGMIRSSRQGTSLFLITYMLFLASLAKKPVYYLPQSFGPLQRKWEVWIIRSLLSRARLVMAREPVSYQNLLDWGIPASICHLVPDLAFSFQAKPDEQGKNWLRSVGVDPQKDGPFLGVTLMNWGAQNREFGGQAIYERSIAAAIRDFVQSTNGRALLLPQSWGPAPIDDDRVPARRVAKLLADLGEALILVERPLPADRLKSVCGMMDIFLGTRVHCNIFALAQNVPVLAIGYDGAISGIAQMVGIPKWVIDINRINENTLVNQFRLLWSECDNAKQRLMHKIPELVRQAYQPGELMASDYFRYICHKDVSA